MVSPKLVDVSADDVVEASEPKPDVVTVISCGPKLLNASTEGSEEKKSSASNAAVETSSPKILDISVRP